MPGQDILDKAPFLLPDMTESKIVLLLAMIMQMGHDILNTLTDYWATVEQFYTPFCSSILKQSRFLNILHFLHFADNRKEIDKDDENYDRL